ncbi:MAG: MvaI/BcnI restriction endonuclease family protein [Candidatus Omnitrophica bacterium]|nr:MvaI/BcnI restriction endonuclease family protein [Candidatus Omnitrophota bacterium]
MKILTKDALIEKLKEIRSSGWIPNARPGNSGGVGNTIEDLLGIKENNLPIPNAAEWELKCQRVGTSLTTLFHLEPSPRALKIVGEILLPKYGWKHASISSEMSFRQTISGHSRSDRGFMVVVDRSAKKVLISFSAGAVDKERHAKWLSSVQKRGGLGELNPQPYWGFDDLGHKAGTKLLNCFYVQAQVRREKGKEFFMYDKILILQRFSIEKFLKGIGEGFVYVDFDARTHHNHGTKFRLRQDSLPDLYETAQTVT